MYVHLKNKSMPIPPQVRADLKRQKNRTPLEQGLAPSSYEFYYVGRPTHNNSEIIFMYHTGVEG